MFDLTLETAKVVDVDDKDQQGKIQINIESRFKNFKKSDYPWAIPLISDVSDSTMSMNLPEKDSQVWVLVDKFYKRFYYLSNRYFYKLFDFSKVKGLLEKCEKINKEYKNLMFRYFSDGSLMFHNNKDGTCGIISSNGGIVYLDKDGIFEIGNAVDTLGAMVSELLDYLSKLKTVGSPANHKASPDFIANMKQLKLKWEKVFK